MPLARSAVHAHEDDLELYVVGKLEPAHTSSVESHLLECETCLKRLSQCIGLRLGLYATGKIKPANNRYERSEPRFSAGDCASFQELSPLSLDRQKVEIVDISKNGIGIFAPKAVLPGTIVQIRIKNTVELGEVRHCSPVGYGGFRIGLRLHS
jgi:hypothetical protein